MEDLVRTIGELLDKAHELQASSNETFVVRTTQQPIDDLKSLEKMLSKYVSRITMSPWTPRERKRKQGGGRITPAELFTALLNRILPQLKQLSSVGVHKVHLDTELPDINSYKDIEDTAMLGLQFKRLQIVMDNTQNFMLLLVIHQGAIVEELKRKSASQADFLVLVHATLNTSIATAYRHLKAYKLWQMYPRIVEVKITITELDALAKQFFDASQRLKKGEPVHESIVLLASHSRGVVVKSVARESTFAEAAPATADALAEEVFNAKDASWNATTACNSLVDDVMATRPDLQQAGLDRAWHKLLQLEQTDPELAAICQQHADAVAKLEQTLQDAYHVSDNPEQAAAAKQEALLAVRMHKNLADNVAAYLHKDQAIVMLNLLCSKKYVGNPSKLLEGVEFDEDGELLSVGDDTEQDETEQAEGASFTDEQLFNDETLNTDVNFDDSASSTSSLSKRMRLNNI